MVKFGIIGYGYWGPNIVRNLNSIKGANVVSICDRRPEVLRRLKMLYPAVKLFRDYRDLARSPGIDAIVVATPVSSHFELVRAALLNGRHVFVEKPFTASSREAQDLIGLAHKNNLKIMVDHTFLFTGAVRKIKELVDKNVLGDLFYYDSTRVNLGLFQHDVNVVWDLIPHDLAVIDYIIKDKPAAISAHGLGHFGRGREDIAYVTVYFNSNIIAHLNVNWLSPVKIRSTLVGGSKKMLVWNDLEPDEKIKIYDKGVKIRKSGIYNLLVDYRSGDVLVPKIGRAEALKTELEHFIEYVENDFRPVNDACAGLRIVKMLEAVDKSLKSNGKLVKL